MSVAWRRLSLSHTRLLSVGGAVKGCRRWCGDSRPTDTNTEDSRHRDAEKEPLPDWPDGVNPMTGEKGGPKGPEPTRYGDWERKGRVSDF